jgi:hypothetical protein
MQREHKATILGLQTLLRPPDHRHLFCVYAGPGLQPGKVGESPVTGELPQLGASSIVLTLVDGEDSSFTSQLLKENNK